MPERSPSTTEEPTARRSGDGGIRGYAPAADAGRDGGSPGLSDRTYRNLRHGGRGFGGRTAVTPHSTRLERFGSGRANGDFRRAVAAGSTGDSAASFLPDAFPEVGVSVRERGQAAIESLVIVPLCVVAGAALVDAGQLVADRIAVQHAASSAGVALVRGEDAAASAHRALPKRLHSGAHTTVDARGVEVSVNRAGVVIPGTVRLSARAAVRGGDES